MKKVIYSLCLILTIFVISFMFASFIVFEINPQKWTEGGRAALVFVNITLDIFGILVIMTNDDIK